VNERGWIRPFDDPIPLPRGRELVTLEDAAGYIMKRPKAEQNLQGWQTATGCLILVAEKGRPHHAGAYWRDAGAKPSRRARVHSRTERHTLGKAA
jgi:hypothetical protein